MRKIFGILAMWLLALWLNCLFVGCDQAPAAKPDETWTKMGHVDDGTGGATVYRKKDPETGKIVYVAIGVNSCSLQVVDGK